MIIGSKRPFIVISLASLIILSLPLVIALVFMPAAAFNEYDLYAYNCWHFTQDTAKHFERLGIEPHIKITAIHTFVEIEVLGKVITYNNGWPTFERLEGQYINQEALEALIAKGYKP